MTPDLETAKWELAAARSPQDFEDFHQKWLGTESIYRTEIIRLVEETRRFVVEKEWLYGQWQSRRDESKRSVK